MYWFTYACMYLDIFKYVYNTSVHTHIFISVFMCIYDEYTFICLYRERERDVYMCV